MKSYLGLGVAFAFVAMAGCGDSGVSPSDQLVGTSWTLEAVEDSNGGVILTPMPGEAYRVAFMADGKIEAVDACNSCDGAYEALSERDLKVLIQSCTEVACTPQSLGYREALANAHSFRVLDGRLRVRYWSQDGQSRVLVHTANPGT